MSFRAESAERRIPEFFSTAQQSGLANPDALVDLGRTEWDARKLDRVRFPSLSGSAGDGPFGFIDPVLVLRACHIIPRFCKGKRYEDGKGMSFCGRDSSDWNEYYINR